MRRPLGAGGPNPSSAGSWEEAPRQGEGQRCLPSLVQVGWTWRALSRCCSELHCAHCLTGPELKLSERTSEPAALLDGKKAHGSQQRTTLWKEGKASDRSPAGTWKYLPSSPLQNEDRAAPQVCFKEDMWGQVWGRRLERRPKPRQLIV